MTSRNRTLPSLLLCSLLVLGCSSAPVGPVEVEDTPAQPAPQKGFEVHQVLPCTGSADELFQRIEGWFNDSTWGTRPVLLSADRATHTFVGRATEPVKYEVAERKGTGTLTYDIRIETSDGSFSVDISNALINGQPGVEEECWKPCDRSPLPDDRDARIARVRQEAMWSQMNYSARNSMSNLPGMLHLGITYAGKP